MTEKQITFLNKLAPMAVRDWNNTHIVLPSITIAQGIHESGWGTSDLAVKANNLFGIKANSDWEPGVKDHSIFLTKPRYAALHGNTDFCISAHVLKLAGYATGPYYSRNIVQHILDYKLYKYDPVQPDFNAIYRVQTNAFSKIENAQAEADKLTKQGFPTCMIKDEETGLIFVQVGAYRARDKACDVACQLILKGYKPIMKVKK